MQKISADPIIYVIVGTQYVQFIDKEISNFINLGLLDKKDKEPRVTNVIKNIFDNDVMDDLWTWKTKVKKQFLCEKIGETTIRVSNDSTKANAVSVIENLFGKIEEELKLFQITKLVYSGLDFMRSADPTNKDVELIITNIKNKISQFYKPNAWPKIDKTVLQFVQDNNGNFPNSGTTGGFFGKITMMFVKTPSYTSVETNEETFRSDKQSSSTSDEEEEDDFEENGCYIKDCEELMLLKPQNHKNGECVGTHY